MISRRIRIALRTLFLPLIALAALSGCTQEQYPQSAVHPRSDYARWIQSLLETQVIWVVIIFVLVQALLIYAAVRYRSRPNAPEPKHVHGHTLLEIAWTIAPAIVLALIAVPTVLTIYKTQGTPPPGALTVRAIGHQWWWEFQYPELGVVTASEMYVPLGRPISVKIETVDVLHSFWFPAAGGKRDAVPGQVNRIWFTPEVEGTYPGQCMELCGISHANMRMKLMVVSPARFDEWVAEQKSPPVEPDSTSLAGEGKRIFRQSLCITCHTVQGVAAGVIGPNLTHVGSRTSLAGSIFPNTPEHMGRWIENSPAQKPGSVMPAAATQGLAADQIPALVAYLQSLK
jgi:cytochrome c oxidase subunit 2